jgi:uncharacterized small protein (DUF1192 family)
MTRELSAGKSGEEAGEMGENDTEHPPVEARPGEDLYGVSVAELDARIAVYQAEIARIEAERVKKLAERDAAHAVFGKTS